MYLSMFSAFSFPLSQSWEKGWGEGLKFWYLQIQPIAPLTPNSGGTGLTKRKKP
jgi:hypothetical protein